MLCRVLFVAAVVSYVLCVLLLSGVQKDELDASTLRKLQRHNVNIDDIGDRKLHSQCLTENNSATTLSNLPVKIDDETKKPTMKPITDALDTQVGDSPAQWDKLLSYLKQQKDQNASHLKETTIQPIIIHSDSNMDTLTSPKQSQIIEDIIGRVTEIPENIVTKNKKEKARYVLQNSDKSHSESSTANYNTINERSNDVEYIRKIVAEILSQRQLNPVQTSTVLPMRTFNANKLVEDIDKMLEENKRNEKTNYSLTTITEKQEYIPDHNKDNREGSEIIEEFLKQLYNPISNLRNSLINNAQTELKQGKVTLYNARNKLSDMLSIVKNEPNNWLHVIDSKSIKPIDSEPLADQNLEVYNQLSERDKAILCKSNNEVHLIQKEIYRYICPYDQISKLTGAMPEERINLKFSRQNERDKVGSQQNKTIWPYFFENQNNGKDQKIEMEHNSLDIKLPIDRYEPMKPDEPGVDDAYKSNWPYFLQRQRNTEEKLYSGNPKLLFNQLNDREQAPNVEIEAGKIKTKSFVNPHYPLESAEVPNRGSDYKSEWASNIQSAKEFEPKLENKQENPTYIRPRAGEKLTNPSYPSFNGEFKNIWPYFLGDLGVNEKPIMVDKNAVYRIPPDREMLLNNQEMMLGKESSVNSRLDKKEKSSKLLSRDRSDPKFINWYDMKGHDIKDNKSSGTLGYIAKEQEKKASLVETTNDKNNNGPNNYETINWPYLIKRQKAQLDLIATEENKKEPLYPNYTEIPKHNNYEYALTQNDEAYNKLLMKTEARSDFYRPYTVNKSKNKIQKENNEKVKSLPLDVLKEIANTVKEIVLRDLKTETSVTSTTTATMPPTTITTTTITSTSTNIPVSSTVITKTEPETATNMPSTTVKEDPIKIQEASQALKIFMELFEKFNLMKEGNQSPNVTQKRDNTTESHRAVVIATVPTMIRNPYAPYKIATMPSMERNLYAPYKIYAPLLPPMSPYGIKSPYLQKAMVLDPYLQKIIQVPDTINKNALDNMHTVGRSAHALTFQTNSNEIKPLKVPVSKSMIVDNIVLSPKPPRDGGRHLREYSEETYKHRKPNRYGKRNEYNTRSNRSRDSDFKFNERPKPRSMKKEHSYNDRFYKPRTNYERVRFHEKLEKEGNWARSSEGKCGSKEGCDDRVVPRQQRPLINIASTYDDTHFRNFLKTQQKVNDMLEIILATKTKLNRRSGEVI